MTHSQQPEVQDAQVDAFIKWVLEIEQAAYERGKQDGYKEGYQAGYNHGWNVASHADSPPTGADA